MSLYNEGEGVPEPASIISAQVLETLQWCLRVFTRQDEAMAAVHLSAVHYSPVTVSVAQALHSLMQYQALYFWPPGTQEMVTDVLSFAALFDSPGPPPPG